MAERRVYRVWSLADLVDELNQMRRVGVLPIAPGVDHAISASSIRVSARNGELVIQIEPSEITEEGPEPPPASSSV